MNKRILTVGNVKKTMRYFKKNGIKQAYYAAKERIEEEKRSDYVYTEPKEDVLAAQRADWKRFPYRFSIVVPAYETKKEFLYELIDSVRKQSYERWELIIADASAGDAVEEIVTEYQEKKNERRLRYLRLIENGGISENTNAGIAEASGDYIGLLDHDDFLASDALYEMAAAIERAKEEGIRPVLLYSDEDKYDNNTCYYKQPNQKYGFNLDLLLSNNYICHFMMAESALMKKLKLRKKYDGAQDYDLVLRIIDHLLTAEAGQDIRKLNEKVLHIPKVLYHWRIHETSTAENTASKGYAYEAGKAALEDFLKKRGWDAKVSHSLHLGFYQVEYVPDLLTVRPEVGIVGGRILGRQNKMISGIYNEKGERLYQGLHKEYSGGSTHRAALMQDCAAVDIRCIRICESLQPFFEKITGVSYRETGTQNLADVSEITCDEAGYRKLSMELGRIAAKKGYLTVWDPTISVKYAKN